jgi:hypothetical protein
MISINTLFFITIIIVVIIAIIKGIKFSFDKIPFDTQNLMTKDNSDVQKDITYDEFISLFKTHSWYIQKEYEGSFFCKEKHDSNIIHAEIWKIDDIGLLAKDYETYKKINDFLNKLWECKQELEEWQE